MDLTHMTLEMSVGIMKSDWETDIMTGYHLHMVANRQTTLENISLQFLLLYSEMIPISLILLSDSTYWNSHFVNFWPIIAGEHFLLWFFSYHVCVASG